LRLELGVLDNVDARTGDVIMTEGMRNEPPVVMRRVKISGWQEPGGPPRSILEGRGRRAVLPDAGEQAESRK